MSECNIVYLNSRATPRLRPNVAQRFLLLFTALLLTAHLGVCGALMSGVLPAESSEPLSPDWGLAEP